MNLWNKTCGIRNNKQDIKMSSSGIGEFKHSLKEKFIKNM